MDGNFVTEDDGLILASLDEYALDNQAQFRALVPTNPDPFEVRVSVLTLNKTALSDFEDRWAPESFILAARRWMRQALTHAHFHIRGTGNRTHGHTAARGT